jgi:uncharacterized membrane protein YfcA
VGPAEIALLAAAGLAAGAVNAVAGGGSLITFPALLAAGLPPIAANTSNAVAVAAGYVASAAGSRTDLAGQGRRVRSLIPTAAVGSALGATLLLVTPAAAFDLVVPFLVLTASLALALQPRLQRIVGHPADLDPRRRTLMLHALTGVGAVYGGYFGGALGVVLVAILALLLDERLNRIGALKNALSTVVGLVCAVVFAVFGPVSWPAVAIVAPLTLVGGYLGALGAKRMPAGVLRAVVVGLGLVVGVVLLVRAFR